jgi:hypothetical protein
LSPATDRFVDLSAKAAVPDPRAVAGGHLAVEPSRAVATDLLVEVEGGECPDSEAIAAETMVVILNAFDDVFGDPPVVGIDPLSMPGPA